MTKQEKKQIEKLQKHVSVFTEVLKNKTDDICNKSKDYHLKSRLSHTVDRLILFESEFSKM